MKMSRILMGVIFAFLMVFTVSAFELDIAETAVLAEDYGELIFSEDFSTYTVGTTLNGGGFVFSQKTTEKYGSKSVSANNAGSGGSFKIAEPRNDKNKMIEITSGVSYPQIRLNFDKLSLTTEGTYNLVIKYYIPSETTMGGIFKETWNGTSLSKTKGEICTVVISKYFSSTVTRIEIQSGTVSGGSWYIDSIELYYKAPSAAGTAVIMYGSSEDDVLDIYPDINPGETITMPSAADMAEYTPDGKFLKGFTVNGTSVAPGEVFTVTDELTRTGTFCFYPVYADAGYGELVFFENFESTSGAVANGGYLTNLMMDTYAGKKVQIYDRDSGSSYQVASPVENGGNMLEISGGNYPQMSLLNLGLNKAGTYVVMFDYYLTSSTAISFMQAGFNNSTTRFDSIVKGEVTPVVLTKTISDGETISSIDIQTGFTNPAFYIDNIRIYYNASSAPVAIKANSIRTSGATGIRFISFANKAVRASAEEYGYMVAFKDDSISDYNTALVFADGERTEGVAVTNQFDVKYLFAANYTKGSKDFIYSENGDFLPDNLSMGDDGVYFTAVMTNIPEQAYNKQLVIRPYIVIGGKIFYGNVVSKSLYEAAVEQKNRADYTENELVEKIIATVENA